MSDLIDEWKNDFKGYIDALDIPRDDYNGIMEYIDEVPSAQPDFDITVKIDKAYDDGYEAGYLQGRHDWGDLDE